MGLKKDNVYYDIHQCDHVLDCLHLDVERSRHLNIYLSWGLDGGNYLLVDGGVLALTVTIKLLALLTYQLGNRGNPRNTIHAMGYVLRDYVP